MGFLEHLTFLEKSRDLTAAVTAEYDSVLVILSVLIAVFSSYVAFALSRRINTFEKTKLNKYWLIMGAFALGGGIWAMHFIGMLAYKLPFPVNYNTTTTVISVLPAFLVSFIILRVKLSKKLTSNRILLRSILMGGGIGLMHYIGMTAMTMNAIMRYDPFLFVFSILLAVLLSAVSLQIKDIVEKKISKDILFSIKLFLPAVFMGCAISAMHYTGMSAMYVFPKPALNVTVLTWSSNELAISITIVILFLSVLLIIAIELVSRFELYKKIKIREQNLTITLNSIGDAVISTDKDGKVVRMNPVAEKLTGWQQQEGIGLSVKDIFIVVNASTRETIENPVEKVISNGETIFLSNHTTLISKNKKEYQIADSASPIRDDNGDIHGMVLVFNDITEQYRLRQQAVKSRRDLQAIMDNTSAVISIKNIEGQYIFINQQFEKLFHIKNEDVINKTDHNIFPKNIADELQLNDKDVLQAKRPLESEEVLPLDDGLHSYLSIKFPLLNENGSIYAVCGISTDITERKRNDEIINNIATGISAETGEAFFQSLVIHLAKLFNAKYAFIGLLDDLKPDIVDTVALCVDGKIIDNLSYQLANTPCEYIIRGDCESIHTFPNDLQRLFPEDPMLVEMGAQSYVGAPLANADGKPVGMIVVMDNKPISQTEQIRSILKIFATRASAEMLRLKTHNELEQSMSRLDQAQHQAHIGNWELDLRRNELYWSDEIFRIFEIDQNKFDASYEAFLNAIHPDDRERVNDAYTQSLENKAPYNIVHRLQMSDGKIKHVVEQCESFFDEEGKPIRSIGTVQDISVLVKVEETLRNTQKMDALGKLTGGIAHDFNNMLGVVMGFSELLQDSLQEQPQLNQFVDEIYHAAERGAKLTKKLLNFSRHKSTESEPININTVLLNERHMLEKTLTARIQLNYDFADDVWQVALDGSDLEDAIVNLSINAMHAMEKGGQLTMRTANQTLSNDDAQLMGIRSGDYVLFSITDTGCGIDSHILEKIFDPFFTTKGDKGTGLGLSQVYGFVERSNGAIKVYSELDHGTQLILYFPRYHEVGSEEVENIADTTKHLTGSETVLVVDDEAALVRLAANMLSNQGYIVLVATSGKEALRILEKENIDILLTDVIMPEMDGYQLATVVQKKYPEIKIQLASGFTDDRHTGMVDNNLHKNLLHKPYNAQTLLKRIRELLD